MQETRDREQKGLRAAEEKQAELDNTLQQLRLQGKNDRKEYSNEITLVKQEAEAARRAADKTCAEADKRNEQAEKVRAEGDLMSDQAGQRRVEAAKRR